MKLPKINVPDLRDGEAPQTLKSLSLEDLRELQQRIQELIQKRERAEADYQMFRRGVTKVTGYRELGKTYRWRTVKCGKPGCKCQNGERHGPYLYAYWRENGQVRSEYLGKAVQVTEEQVRSND